MGMELEPPNHIPIHIHTYRRTKPARPSFTFTLNPFSPPLMVALLVFIHLPFAIATHKTTNLATSFPNFQHLSVPQAIAAIKSLPLSLSLLQSDSSLKSDPNSGHTQFYDLTSDNNSSDSKLKLKLLHRDSILSGENDHRRRFSGRLRRDSKRVAGLVRRLSNKSDYAYDNEEVVSSFGSDVVSGMDQGSGEYFVRIGVGSPPRSQYVVIDSGSDIIWVQCQPCNQCYRQSDPVFNPTQSASFSGVSCGSSVCARVESSGCRSGHCGYEVEYSDGSYTKGTLAFETLTFGGTTIKNVAIGCGHRNKGMFVGAAGLLGLGGGSMSFVGQLGGQTGGAFGYCLVSRGGAASSSLVFGREAVPVGAAWIGLIRNPRAPSFYYIGLAGLGVGGVRVPLPNGVFTLSESGDGGVVMDTGTAVTRLPTAAYEAFRDSFITQTANLPRAPGESIFDTCYNLGGFISVRVPTVSFYFSDGPILTLPARNFLIPVNEEGTFCFAFAPSPSGLSIIGNIQQEGIQISIDGANGFVGFGPNVC